MILVRHLCLALLVAGTPMALATGTLVGIAQAADEQAFTPAAFEVAQKAGIPILVEVTAPWCPTCKAQKPILSELAAQPKFAKLAIFKVDFDSQKDVLKKLGVQMQSTLISYRGAREVGRSTGVTDRASIEAQLNKSV